MLIVGIFVALLLARTFTELYLLRLNSRELERHAEAVPEAYREVMDAETYAKSVRYTRDKLRLAPWETVWSAVVLLVLLAGGALAALYGGLTDWLGQGLWAQALIVVLVALVVSLLDLPIDLYSTFKLEARHGFNKSTPQLWLMDKLKGTVLAVLLATPLMALLLWFFQVLPQTWWLWGWGAFFGFQLLLLVLYPRVILPLFNKLEPLPEGELRERLVGLGQRAGFTVTNIHVMDGSKRSGHSNALFTGFGKFRRIILFDTLVEQLQPRPLEAVLAHEAGHYQCGHIPKLLLIAGVSSLLGFAAVGYLAQAPWFAEAFGFAEGSPLVPTLLLVSFGAGVLTYWLTPLSNRRSRKHEYEADAYARDMMNGDPEPLIEALRQLYRKNLSNLTPHPAYSQFHYSHPTLMEREGALRKTE